MEPNEKAKVEGYQQASSARLWPFGRCHTQQRTVQPTFSFGSTLEDQILEAQKTDTEIVDIRENLKADKAKEFSEDARGIIRYRNRLVVPSDSQLKELILKEAHNSKFSIHPGSTKMYQDLKKAFWWSQMKR